jgi:Arc/MetJ family transcription regulator
MRTTVDLDEDLLREVKRRAADSGCTMSETVRHLLRVSLAVAPPTGKRLGRVKLITFSGSPEAGLQPDVDLKNNVELRDILDEAETADWREQMGYGE